MGEHAEKNNELNDQDTTGEVVLHKLCQKYYGVSTVFAVQELLKAGAQPNFKNGVGDTPIHMLTSQDSWLLSSDQTLMALLNASADINLPSKRGNCPLFCTVFFRMASASLRDRHQSFCEPIGKMIEMRADVNEYLDNGTVLHYLAENTEDATKEIELLMRAGADATVKHLSEGATVLHCLTKQAWCHADIVHAMLDAHVDANAKRHSDGATALHCLATAPRDGRSESNCELMGKMIEMRADVLECSDNGTVLHCLAGQPYDASKEIGLLMRAGADATVKRSSDGATILHCLGEQLWCRADIVSTLLGAHVDASAKRTSDGATALHCLAQTQGTTDIMSVLLDANCDANAQSKDGSTVLHCLASRSRRIAPHLSKEDRTVKLLMECQKLIDAGADEKVKCSTDGLTARQRLREAGVDWNLVKRP